MPGTKEYHVNLFKPRTPHGKSNTKMILSMILIWFVSIFGFQALLIIMNKPTPEKSYLVFQKIWPSITERRASIEEKQDFARVLLFVLGKNIAVKQEHKSILKETLSTVISDLMPPEERNFLSGNIDKNIDVVVNKSASVLGLNPSGFDKLMIELLPSSLVTASNNQLTKKNLDAIPQIMKLYLVHNQSVLTDTKFLGFPFHYFYVSQALLIGFVLLCLIYCVATEKIHAKYGFVEEKEES